MTKEEILLDHIGEYQVKWRPQTTANIYRAMDSYYNVAIQDAIAKCNEEIEFAATGSLSNTIGISHLKSVIEKLESLKK